MRRLYKDNFQKQDTKQQHLCITLYCEKRCSVLFFFKTLLSFWLYNIFRVYAEISVILQKSVLLITMMNKYLFCAALTLLLWSSACQQQQAPSDKEATEIAAPAATETTPPAAATPSTVNVSVKSLKESLENKGSLQLLDVRTAEETKDGMLPQAINVDFYDKNFVDKAKSLLNPQEKIIVYCAVGGRSSEAVQQLKAAGFPHVYNLEGGYEAWKTQQ